MIQPFPQAEVAEVVGAEFVPQEGGELFVLLEQSVLPVGAKNVAAVLDPGDGVKPAQIHGGALALGKLRPQDQCPVVEALAVMSVLSRSAAPCSGATSSTARKALSFLRKPMLRRFNSCSMTEWPLSQYVAWNGKKWTTCSGRVGKGKKGFQGKETAGFVPLRLRRKISNIFG
ncbi:MAG: hypothetical protein AAB225_10225 [Acidobacteriota bacterium]